ncbi:MAG TPA: Uma2 family endonuclease [Gemmataceae bacterium]|jgi:Uma2 family endonuclease|nr:Uma2 family endonuclease [Gemmataceae bacterium]
MSTIPSMGGLPPIPPVPIRRFTVDEYHRMIDAGILREGDRHELLNGWIVPKMTRNPPHDLALGLVEDALLQRMPAGWFRRGQSAVTVSSDSEPEPDVAVVRGDRRDYGSRHPGPQDMGLAVEVSDSTLAQDRTVKLQIYARARVPVYWIVNLPDTRVEVYTDPTGPDPAPAYRQRRDFGPADEVPLVLDGAEVGRIPVRDLLP